MPSKQVTIQGVMTWDDAGYPSHPIAPGGPPPGIWPGPGVPTHPIAGPPPGIWPSPGRPDQGLPGDQPGIWPGQGHPSHPISGGGYVIGWSPTYGFVFIPLGGYMPPSSPGEPTHPIADEPKPEPR